MKIPEHYLESNRDAWNKRTTVHIDSDFYNVAGFLKGASSLNDTELELLGDLKGKAVLHLQCHFGLDTLSLARLGAQVTGVDLSDESVAKANELNTQLGLGADFICCDLYDLPHHCNKQYDIVFTSYGTIGWLPDLDKWGKVVSRFLKPEGKFVMVDFHPVIWMYNNDFSAIAYSYFNTEAIVEASTGTYTDRTAPINYEEIGWNHSLSEIFSGLMENGLQIETFREYNYANYNCFPQMEAIGNGKFRITPMSDKAPLMYAIVARPATK